MRSPNRCISGSSSVRIERDVRVDPLAPVEHDRAHVAGRVQPGVLGDELLGDDRSAPPKSASSDAPR